MQDCVKPEVPRNAIISNPSESYRSGDKVAFECKEGFNQEGIATQMCFQGQWTVLPFKCSGKLNIFWIFSTNLNLLFYSYYLFNENGTKTTIIGKEVFQGLIYFWKSAERWSFFGLVLKSVHFLAVKSLSVALWRELFSQLPFLYRFQPLIGVFVNP